MKVLDASHRYLAMLGLYSERPEKSSIEFLKYFRSYFFLAGSVYAIGFCSAVYLYNNLSDLATSTNALIILTAAMCSATSFISIGIYMPKIKFLCRECQTIADAAQRSTAYRYYVQEEQSGQKITRLLAGFLVIDISVGAFCMAIGNALYQIFVLGNHDGSDWYLPYRITTGVDRSTIHGFAMTTLIQMWGGYSYNLTISAAITYFVSVCYYIRACCQEINHVFNDMDRTFGVNGMRSIKKIENDIKRVIVFHIKIMKMFEALQVIISGTMFSQLISNVIFFASSIYQVEMTTNQVTLGIFFNVHCIFISIALPLLLCYHATYATDAMSLIGQNFYDAKWYLFPIYLRKYSMLIIARSQKNIFFTGFKIVRSTLETFTSLTKAATSYYIMFRNMAAR